MYPEILEMLMTIGIGAGLVTIPIQIRRLNQQKTAKEMPLVNWLIGMAFNLVQMLYYCQIKKPIFAYLSLTNFFLCSIVAGQIVYYQIFFRNSRG